MTIHIYAERELVCSLEFDSLKSMSPIFKKFQDFTGICISEYDDVVLAPNHAGLLVQLIDEFYVKCKITLEISKLRKELWNSYDLGKYLDLVGE